MFRHAILSKTVYTYLQVITIFTVRKRCQFILNLNQYWYEWLIKAVGFELVDLLYNLITCITETPDLKQLHSLNCIWTVDIIWKSINLFNVCIKIQYFEWKFKTFFLKVIYATATTVNYSFELRVRERFWVRELQLWARKVKYLMLWEDWFYRFFKFDIVSPFRLPLF